MKKSIVYLIMLIASIGTGCAPKNSDMIEDLKDRNTELSKELSLLQTELDEMEDLLERFRANPSMDEKEEVNYLLSANSDYLSSLVMPSQHFLPFGSVKMIGYRTSLLDEDSGEGLYRDAFVILDTDPLLLDLYEEWQQKGNRLNPRVDERVSVYFESPYDAHASDVLIASNSENPVEIYVYLYRSDSLVTYRRVPDLMKILAVSSL